MPRGLPPAPVVKTPPPRADLADRGRRERRQRSNSADDADENCVRFTHGYGQAAAPKGLLIVQPLSNLLFLKDYASSSASSGAGIAQVGVSSRVMFLVATMPD